MSLPFTSKEDAARGHVSRLSALSWAGLGRPWEDTVRSASGMGFPCSIRAQAAAQGLSTEGEVSSGLWALSLPGLSSEQLVVPYYCQLRAPEMASEDKAGHTEGLLATTASEFSHVPTCGLGAQCKPQEMGLRPVGWLWRFQKKESLPGHLKVLL